MKQRSYRVTYRSDDRLGRVDFVRDVVAVSLSDAIRQAHWQLVDAHPNDHEAYREHMAVEIPRDHPEITGVPT